MIDTDIEKRIESSIDRNFEKMKYISDFLFKNPELGGEEYIASEFLADIMEKEGFNIRRNYCDLETAFLCEFVNGEGPVLAIIVEYDALPGFGPNDTAGHACGHNWISAVGVGTAMVMHEIRDSFSGTLKVIGTPAMENLGCKADMIREHAFDDVDVVIQSHLEEFTNVGCKFLALDALEFRFRGRSSHASASPEDGVNALDAVQFLCIGLNAMRQYVRPDVKINGIVSNGGDVPSVIPGNASCQYYFRADDRKYLEKIKPGFIRCAEGAALMAGAELEVCNFENPLDNMININELQELALKYMEKEGIYSDDPDTGTGYTSSDIGNVSHVCPTLYMEFNLEADDVFRVHEKEALRYVNSEYASRKLRQVTKIMAEILVELYNNNELLGKIKLSHSKIMQANAVK